MHKWLLAVALILGSAIHVRGEIHFDSTGQSRTIIEWPTSIPFGSSVWVVQDQWQTILEQSKLKDIRHRNKSISGTFEMESGSIDFEQSTRELAKATHIDYELSTRSTIKLEGIYWFGSIDIDRFAGGWVSIAGNRRDLPEQQGEKVVMSGESDRIEITDKASTTSITIKFDRQVKITLQDAREFGANVFQIYVPILEDEFKSGMRARLSVSIAAELPQDNSPARLSVDANNIVSRFDGFGGNFVYDLESPVTDFNLRTLKLTWARLGMDLTDWEPTNDNASPAEPVENWGNLVDTQASSLRRRFLLDQRVHQLSGDRTIVSVWRMPEWMYDHPLPLSPKSLRDQAGTIRQDKWPELIECITTYLLHLRNNYGVEPSLFSFNEPDYGIYLLLNGEEMNQLYQQVGRSFEAAGLKTRLMLPDSASLKQGMEIMQPALKDAETMKYVGALAYHAWTGERSLWNSWADIAEEHGLPLLVTEAGLDANSWRDSSYNSPINALRLSERYVQILNASRARGIMEWEWTGDYSLCHIERDRYRPSSRYWMMWQLTHSKPVDSRIAATTSNKMSVQGAMILSGEGEEPAFSLHISNTGQQRKVVVSGLPSIGGRLKIISTEFLTDRVPTVRQIDFPRHELELDVPAGSLVTVTTMQVDEPRR